MLSVKIMLGGWQRGCFCRGSKPRGGGAGFCSKGRKRLFMSRTLTLGGSTLVLFSSADDDYEISTCKVGDVNVKKVSQRVTVRI